MDRKRQFGINFISNAGNKRNVKFELFFDCTEIVNTSVTIKLLDTVATNAMTANK